MPRFVILRHDHPRLHWDLMLETGDALRTWRLEREPVGERDRLAATALGDHRLFYLDYEGPVSGGRGTVARWDAGVYDEDKAESARDRQRVRVRLEGARVTGWIVLDWQSGDDWSFAWEQSQ